MNTAAYQPGNLLVTGGCGFIGTNFLRLVLSEPQLLGQSLVVNVDKLTYAGNAANLADLEDHPQYRFAKIDICDAASITQLLADYEIDTVVHFAAESHVDRSIQDSTPFVQTNVIGTQVLLDAARGAGIGRFVQVSTDEVYGSLGESGLFTETTPLAPNSPYSASKAAGDLLVRSYCHTFGFPAITTRCSNNYGPYQFPEKLIPLFIANALEHKSLPVYGDGMQVRDWIHVADHCRGIIAALKYGQIGEVYNFGGRCELKNIELVKSLLRILDRPETLIEYVSDRPGHDRRYAIDCAKAERELGWSPQAEFADGLQETVQWYLANAAWTNDIRSGEYRHYYEKQYTQRS